MKVHNRFAVGSLLLCGALVAGGCSLDITAGSDPGADTALDDPSNPDSNTNPDDDPSGDPNPDAPYTGDDWWNVGQQPGNDDDIDDDNDDDPDDDNDDDDPLDSERVFWGEVSSDGGLIGLYEVVDGTVVCDMDYQLDGVTEVNDCTTCTAAYALQIGALEIFDQVDDRCTSSEYGGLTGQTLRIGVASGRPYIDSGSGWAVVNNGEAEQDGDDFFFRIGEWSE